MIRPGLRNLYLGTTFALSWIVITPVHADPRSDHGAAHAFAKADYQTALDLYSKSYSDSARPSLLVRMADCQRLLGRNADALGNYQAYVDTVPRGSARKQALAHIAELGPIVEAEKAAAEAAAAPPAPAPQQSDTEAPPMSAVELAKKQREAERALHAKVSAFGPHADEPRPPGFDPSNYVLDPHDPKIAPPPAHTHPPGYKVPIYDRWWLWTIVGIGVGVGAGVGFGVEYGIPKFNSELPVGGPGAQAMRAVRVRF